MDLNLFRAQAVPIKMLLIFQNVNVTLIFLKIVELGIRHPFRVSVI
jgi:hypothetical protein